MSLMTYVKYAFAFCVVLLIVCIIILSVSDYTTAGWIGFGISVVGIVLCFIAGSYAWKLEIAEQQVNGISAMVDYVSMPAESQ